MCSGGPDVFSDQRAALVWRQQNAYSCRTQPQGGETLSVTYFLGLDAFFNVKTERESTVYFVSCRLSCQVLMMQRKCE